jgi:hypothetical protein
MDKYLKLIADAPSDDSSRLRAPVREPRFALAPSADTTVEPAEWRAGLVRNSRSPLIPDAVRAIVEGIEGEARAKGWPAELLWNAEFWGSPRGLSAVLDASDAIGEITSDFIEIVKSKRSILRFPRRAS